MVPVFNLALGNQKKTNYALRADMTEEEFIKELLTGLTTPPAYFPKNVLMNIRGYESLDDVKARGLKGLSVSEFETLAEQNDILILDTRKPEVFSQGFIPNSLNISLDGQFAMWVGELISDIKQQIILVTEEGREEEALIRLARVGYDFSVGYLTGGFEAWKNANKPVKTVQRITAQDLEKQAINNPIIIDVRKKSEFDSEHLEQAINIPLNVLTKNLASFPKDKPFILHCAGGYRSVIAASLLKQNGYENFVDVIGGFGDISKTSLPKTAYVCPTTLL